MDIDSIIEHGIVFKKKKETTRTKNTKIKTKARTTSYIKGAHGSDSAKKKAEIRLKRANRHK